MYWKLIEMIIYEWHQDKKKVWHICKQNSAKLILQTMALILEYLLYLFLKLIQGLPDNPLTTSPVYTRAGVYEKCML